MSTSLLRGGEKNTSGDEQIFVVLGMHRSGTSLCASMLNLMGINIADGLGAGPGNELGHFERWDLVSANDRLLNVLNRGYYTLAHDFSLPPCWWSDMELSGIREEIKTIVASKIGQRQKFGLKDPRLSRLLPIYKAAFSELKLSPNYIICLRHPSHVAKSLNTRDGLDPVIGEYRWLVYMVDALRNTKDSRRIIVKYEDWFEEATSSIQLKRLLDFVSPEILTSETEIMYGLRGLVSENMNRSGGRSSLIRRPIIKHYFELLTKYAEQDESALGMIDRFNSDFMAFQQLTDVFECSVSTAIREKCESESRLEETRADYLTSSADIASLREQLAAQSARAEHIKSEGEFQREALAKELECCQEIINVLRKDRTESENKLEKIRADYSTSAADAASLREQLAVQIAHVEQIKSACEAQRGAFVKDLENCHERLGILRRERAESESKLAEVRADYAASNADIASLREQLVIQSGFVEQIRSESEMRLKELNDNYARLSCDIEAEIESKNQLTRDYLEARELY
ncbi:hypothetical protein ACRAWG_25570 [Methylobacterium sp. P31]